MKNTMYVQIFKESQDLYKIFVLFGLLTLMNYVKVKIIKNQQKMKQFTI